MTSPQHLYTIEEYLALDAAAPRGVRHEYANGQVTAMSGAEPNHELLVARLLALLDTNMRGRPCRVFGSNLRVGVRASRAYKYPDVSGLCGRAEFEPTRPQTFLNPSVLVEVLSPSTESRDRGAKFAHYELIPTLSEYVLVAQDEMRVERYLRRGASWQYDRFTHAGDVVTLPSVGCEFRLGDAYEHVEFPDDPPPTMPRLVREPDAPAWAEA
ncbi:MAG TPA: Uma2 family endonuclease [Gemmatirosa sp.]